MSVRFTTGEKRRLRRYACAWCGQRLDRESCGAIYELCTEEQRAARRRRCLEEYRPRMTRSPAQSLGTVEDGSRGWA